jgi:hypothetical protein
LGNEILNQKYQVEKKELSEWENDGKYFNIVLDEPYFDVITRLDKNDQIIREKTNIQFSWEELRIKELEESCSTLIESIKDLKYNAKERSIEHSISKEDIDKIIEALNTEILNIENIKSILYH